MLCACRCIFGRCAGPCSCNPAGCHRWCPRIKVHFGKGAGLCGRITILTLCSSHPLRSLLRAFPVRASYVLAMKRPSTCSSASNVLPQESIHILDALGTGAISAQASCLLVSMFCHSLRQYWSLSDVLDWPWPSSHTQV